MMNVGILGGTRFIGFHLAEAFLARGDKVTILHRGRQIEPHPFSGSVNRVFGDRSKPDTLEPFFSASYDALIDLSGYTTAHVEPLLSRWRGKIGHYVFCSTTAVYRRPPPLPFDEQAARALEPGTYGGDKARAEDAILNAARRHCWPATVLRPQGVFGPFDPGPWLVYIWQRLRATQPIPIRPETSGKKITPLWIGDLTNIFLCAVGNPKAFGQIFNATGTEAITPEHLTILAAKTAQMEKCESFVLERQVSQGLPHLGLPWERHDLVADARKVWRELELAATPLEQALHHTWDWCRSQPGLLEWRPQRWEQQARQDRPPPTWKHLYWRLRDHLRLLPIVDRCVQRLRRKRH